jgi:hypothetical protein
MSVNQRCRKHPTGHNLTLTNIRRTAAGRDCRRGGGKNQCRVGRENHPAGQC